MSDKTDANDYSRFDNIDNSDDETDVKPESKDVSVDLTITEILFQANGLKETGNAAFKSGDLLVSKQSYTQAISLFKKKEDDKKKSTDSSAASASTVASASDLLEPHHQEQKTSLLVSLHGNLAMIFIKVCCCLCLLQLLQLAKRLCACVAAC